jgi:hypothetical protein
MTTTQASTLNAALVNQRAVCGQGMFWDLRLWYGGLQLETDDSATTGTRSPRLSLVNSTGADAGMRVNDGRPHQVLVRRVAGTATIYIDGVASGSGPDSAMLGALPPLTSGTDVCDGHSQGTVPFVGTITGICLTSP